MSAMLDMTTREAFAIPWLQVVAAIGTMTDTGGTSDRNTSE